jgi:hypothetical protein
VGTAIISDCFFGSERVMTAGAQCAGFGGRTIIHKPFINIRSRSSGDVTGIRSKTIDSIRRSVMKDLFRYF